MTCLALAANASAAYARDDVVLERLLLACSDFRVRARAAAALARSQSPVAGPALEAALIDRHPAVRQAAATALGKLRAMDALPALRVTERDPVPRVARHARESIAIIERTQRRGSESSSSAPKRYGLRVGELHDHSSADDPVLLSIMSSSLVHELGELEGAAVVAPAAAPKAIPMFRIDASVIALQRATAPGSLSTHASVALLLTDESDQTLRIVFRGSATAIEEPDVHVANQRARVTRIAIQRAVRAALRNASAAIGNGLAKPASAKRKK